jgi:hypothetical protein
VNMSERNFEENCISAINGHKKVKFHVSLYMDTQQERTILLELLMVMKIFFLNCVDLME